jgi:hypothetical protein
MTDKLTLLDIEGPTSVHIEAEITDGGDLLLSGQDVGEAPRAFHGDSDYEYWLRIGAADKDRVLLALLEKLYSGNPSLISQLREYLESKGIPTEFSCY